jgi:small conductance mechanosensitive channel
LIFWDKPFVVGDWITTEGQYGKVTNITLRTTRIRTPRNTFVVVPNKRIIDELLENHSKHGELRVDVPIGIAYKEDIREAREVLLGAVDTVEQALDDPRPDLVVDELGGSSVNLKVRVWVASADDQRTTYYEVTEKAKLALDKGGIEIPFPHLQLYVDNVEDKIWAQASELATGLRKAS